MYVLHKRQHSEHADGETMETTVWVTDVAFPLLINHTTFTRLSICLFHVHHLLFNYLHTCLVLLQ
jgi:hypothetical protein